MQRFSRRDLFRYGAGGVSALGVGVAAGCAPDYVPPANGTPFTLGVMSGLHSEDAVVLWTRLDPAQAPSSTTVRWTLATDPTMSTVVRSGDAVTSPERDYTVKVLVEGLAPDRRYWYRFDVDGVGSRIGVARTLPSASDESTSLRLAVASCQNWGQGWYHAWSGIAAERVDAVLWLGDYIYENTTTLFAARRDTSGEALDLASYRAKYRYYRSDPVLQDGHAAHPFVPIWDDHEFVNDCNRHTNLAFPERASAAYQAWFDYMPVWPIDGSRIYRELRWGRLASIAMLDSRQYRDHPANGFLGVGPEPLLGIGDVVREANTPGRTMLGAPQREWLTTSLSAAHADGVRWKLLGNQVMMTPTRAIDFDEPDVRALFPDLPRNDGLFINMDSWNSYLWERQQLLDHIYAGGIDGVAVLTGDIHCFWKSRQRLDIEDPTSPVVATEYVTGAISSTTPNILRTDDFGRWLEQAPIAWGPAFDFSDFRHHGYGVVDLTPEQMTVNFRYTMATERYWGVSDGETFTQGRTVV